ncbi:M48 family metallopeptidase [Pedobacter sp. MW01-1-1]|uniref:M48 family metallopeptidase n=1 Tax=Pedobacter sp. MW01-1-1 TaxID=3383027 RepID=UPI003FEFE087
MITSALKPSEKFQKMAIQAVLAIVLFVLVYLILVALAIGLTILCCFLGISLIVAHPSFITLMLGGGALLFGILIFSFLIKFIFKSTKIDRSHLTEITAEEHPKLFELIRSIVAEVGTKFPKKVYVSSEVNASVFYDSSFWSMFFPVRKNLQIGLGLMNGVSTDELSAILAHEFGHFSQKSMKVGSYVYNVNQVIYNMLYENEGFGEFASKAASISNYFALFVTIADKVIQGIQFVLIKLYNVINLSHLALSREMEFHADTVAAHVTGSAPLIDSLLRLSLADSAMETVLSYYSKKISVNERPDNIYPQHHFVMDCIAQSRNFPMVDGVPQIPEEFYSKFNRSKLVIKNQWASHPSTEERIAHLKQLNIPTKTKRTKISIELLADNETVYTTVTGALFSRVSYEKMPTITDFEKFKEEYLKEFKANTYPLLFNNYYDYRNPAVEMDEAFFIQPLVDFTITAKELFDDERLTALYENRSIQNDLESIKQIADKRIDVKSFDYDGQKYSIIDCDNLLNHLQNDLDENVQKLKEFDKNIFEYFRFKAAEQDAANLFKEHFFAYKAAFNVFEKQCNTYDDLVKSASFVHETTPFEIIEQKMVALKEQEVGFKAMFLEMVNSEEYTGLITAEMKERTLAYVNTTLKYFAGKQYFDQELEVFFTALNDFLYLISEKHSNAKRELLNFEVSLETTVLTA